MMFLQWYRRMIPPPPAEGLAERTSAPRLKSSRFGHDTATRRTRRESPGGDVIYVERIFDDWIPPGSGGFGNRARFHDHCPISSLSHSNPTGMTVYTLSPLDRTHSGCGMAGSLFAMVNGLGFSERFLSLHSTFNWTTRSSPGWGAAPFFFPLRETMGSNNIT
jgi:hypothetical protein